MSFWVLNISKSSQCSSRGTITEILASGRIKDTLASFICQDGELRNFWKVDLEETSGMVLMSEHGNDNSGKPLPTNSRETKYRSNSSESFYNIHVLNRVSKLQERQKLIQPFIFQFQPKSMAETAQ